MKTEEMKNKIESIMFSSRPYGLTVFAYINDGENSILKKFLVNDKLRNKIKDVINPVIKNKFLSDDTEMDSADNISDNRNVLYEIVQDDSYSPFNFINEHNKIVSTYSEKEQNSLSGLFFRINQNNEVLWLYQNIYKMRMIKRSSSLYAMLTTGDTYVPLDRDVLKIDSRIDIIIIDDSIITSNISLLQQTFGFDQYVRSEAEKTINLIKSLDIVSDTEKILAFEDKPKLTNAKKLLKAKSSPV